MRPFLLFILLAAAATLTVTGCATQSASIHDSGNCEDCPSENHLLMVISQNSTARFYISAEVDGRARKFFLDTGSARSQLVVDPQTSALTSEGKATFGGVTLAPNTCDWVKINTFRIESLTYSHAPFARCEYTTAASNTLGIDYLNNQVVTLGFEKATFAVAPPGKEKLRYEMRRSAAGYIEIPIKIDGAQQWGIFDSGSGLTVIDQALVDAHPSAFNELTVQVDGKARPVEANFVDSTGVSVVGRTYIAGGVEIGETTLEPHVVTAFPFSPELKKVLGVSVIIGATSMVRNNWIFDLKNNRWAMTAFTQSKEPGPDIQLSADEISVYDEKTSILRGHARLVRDGYEFSAPEIMLDREAKIAECLHDCTLIEAAKTTKAERIKIHLGDDKWEQLKWERLN